MKNIKTYEQFKRVTFNDVVDSEFSDVSSDISCDKITINSKNMTDLEGIEKYKNIVTLDIVRNKITSLKGIENLNKLQFIWCLYNKITSLEPIENLTNLKYISCYNNKITSLKGIENLTKLESILCHNNPINWIDYVDKDGRTYYTKLPKSIEYLSSDKFHSIEKYLEFMDKNQPVAVSRKFNF